MEGIESFRRPAAFPQDPELDPANKSRGVIGMLREAPFWYVAHIVSMLHVWLALGYYKSQNLI